MNDKENITSKKTANVINDAAKGSKDAVKKVENTATNIVKEATTKAQSPAPIETVAKKSASTAKKSSAAQKKAVKRANEKVVTMSKDASAIASNNHVNTSSNDRLNASRDATQAGQQVLALGADSVQQLGQHANAAAKVMNESVAIGQEHMEALVEASHIAAEHTNKISDSIIEYANQTISNSVDMSKEFFNCRTASDMFDLQSRIMQTGMERFFDETSRLSDMIFDMASKTSEPISDQMTETTERLNNAVN